MTYSLGPNAEYKYNQMMRGGGSYDPNDFRDFSGGGGGGGGAQHNMRAQTPYAPENQGGPGNPGGAHNMGRTLPRFAGGGSPYGQPGNPYGGINPGNMYGTIRQLQQSPYMGQGTQNTAPSWVNNKGPAPMGPQDWQDRGGKPNIPQLPMPDQWQRGDTRPGQRGPLLDQLRQQFGGGGDPFNRYGTAGQSQQLGRYQPPMMGAPNTDPTNWFGGGGYSYNIPNSYGSGQWNQFNSTDRSFPMFGQSQNAPVSVGVQRNGAPIYQSPFSQPDPSRQANLDAYFGSLFSQPGKPMTQPGTPDQPVPVT